jgi:TfoX/Sxy family transcriptional regulator of competence genes
MGFAVSGRTIPKWRKKHHPTIPRHTIMPAAKKTAPNEALYDKLIATIPEIERKGDANPYTSLNGNMFTLLHQSRLAIRLPDNEREKFLKKYKTSLFEAYGTVMKEYVAVPDDLLPNTKELKKYLELSYSYAKTLKAKPTKKSK